MKPVRIGVVALCLAMMCQACAPAPALPGPCPDVNARAGELVCVHSIQSDTDFAELAGFWRETPLVKFLMPVLPGLPLVHTTYFTPRLHLLHLEFMRERFLDDYAALDEHGYVELVFTAREDRSYYSGTISVEEGEYVFRVGEDRNRPQSAIAREDVIEVWEMLRESFHGTLSFAPLGERQESAARNWQDLPFEIYGSGGNYEAYRRGRACGFVRILGPEELATLAEMGSLSFRDILVLDDAPADLESIVSGIVTGVTQGPLSHLSVRSASRGTPNVYLRDARATFEEYAGDLICFEADAHGVSIERAERSEAEAFWATIRPNALEIPFPDVDDATIHSLRSLPTDTPETRTAMSARYGAKGTNLATLYQRIERFDGYHGVLLPAFFYAGFMNEGTWVANLNGAEQSFAETLSAWNASPVGDEDWTRLQEAMRDAPISADTIAQVYESVVGAFGNERTMVRFRSSSNAEDSAGFSGAGLYDSTSVCPADDFDDDVEGPSLCDASVRNERTIARGLGRVWSSLWNTRARNERGWYGIDEERVVMPILVNDRAADERANIVAFSGNPLSVDDERTFISAQVGDVDLVRPPSGVRAEHWLYDRSAFELTSVGRSTESQRRILALEQIAAIATLLAEAEDYLVDDSIDGRVLLDSEWKILADGSLVIKQIRPFVAEL
ncbi:MAG: hypothetical protein ACI9KE_003493 [Polyangiales bacterium]|jgi:hypothetical protein